MCRICNSPPGNLGNRAGRLAVYKPFTGSPRVLLITTQGRPTHLTCGQTVLRIIILRPGSWQKGQLPPLSGQKGSLGATTQACHPFGEWQLCRSLSWRFFHRRSPGRERTRMAGIDFSSYRLNVFLFPVHPIAQEKGPIASRFKKFFQFFSETHHPKVDRLLCQAGFLSDFMSVVAGHP